jgi:hypothetical protein
VGDELVRVLVWTPSKPSAREKELLEELGRLENGKVPPPGKGVFEKFRDAFSK